MRKFESLVDEFGLDDGGVASFTFKVQSLKKGKIYLEQNLNVVIDDNGCWLHITDVTFSKKFKEIKL